MRGLFEGICPFLKRWDSVQFCSFDLKIIADVQMQTLISSFSSCCHLNCVKMRLRQKMGQFATPLLEPEPKGTVILQYYATVLKRSSPRESYRGCPNVFLCVGEWDTGSRPRPFKCDRLIRASAGALPHFP